MLTDTEVKAIVERALLQKDLWSAVDESKSQFLELEYFFSHLVLTDASRYEPVVDAMSSLQRDLSQNGQELRFLVRSTWEIIDAEYRGPYYDSNGGLRSASDVIVRLRSGNRIHRLRVAVSWMAGEVLQAETGTAERDYTQQTQDITQATSDYIRMLLAGRGTADAWDPLWEQGDLEITANTMRWIESRIKQATT